MSALTKSSILLLPVIAIAVYSLHVAWRRAVSTPAPSHRAYDICKQDGDRLAQLQAKPSLDEAVRLGSELRCLRLWPQLQAILDSLSHTTGSIAVSSSSDVAPDATSAGDAAMTTPSSPAMEATSATSDDACKHDEDRLRRTSGESLHRQGDAFWKRAKVLQVAAATARDFGPSWPQWIGWASNDAAPDTAAAQSRRRVASYGADVYGDG